MSFTDIYSITGSAMTAQTVRLNTVASNLANADAVSANPDDAYKALKPVFATVYQKTQMTTENAFTQMLKFVLSMWCKTKVRRKNALSQITHSLTVKVTFTTQTSTWLRKWRT